MIKSVKSGFRSEHGNAVLYAGLLGLILSDIIPTPADAIYFRVEKRLRDKWKKGEIEPKQYWTRDAIAYYGLNPIWWALVAGVTLSIKGDTNKKLKIALALIGSGAVVGILYRNVKKDEQERIKELSELNKNN